MAENSDRLKAAIGGLLESRFFGVLATAGEAGPYTSLVGFTPGAGLREIFFATFTGTRKYGNLQRDPRVSLLVDDRANRAVDLLEARALTVCGRASRVGPGRQAAVRAACLARFPGLADFYADPHCVLVAISVSRYILVERFQEVWHLEMDEKPDDSAR